MTSTLSTSDERPPPINDMSVRSYVMGSKGIANRRKHGKSHTPEHDGGRKWNICDIEQSRTDDTLRDLELCGRRSRFTQVNHLNKRAQVDDLM